MSEIEDPRVKAAVEAADRAAYSVLGEARDDWSAAWAALHHFARMSGCPAGHNVIRWFEDKGDAVTEATGPAIKAALTALAPSSPKGTT